MHGGVLLVVALGRKIRVLGLGEPPCSPRNSFGGKGDGGSWGLVAPVVLGFGSGAWSVKLMGGGVGAEGEYEGAADWSSWPRPKLGGSTKGGSRWPPGSEHRCANP